LAEVSDWQNRALEPVYPIVFLDALRVKIHDAESRKDRKAVAKVLDDFDTEWGQKYPSIAPSWRRAWQKVIPFFAFPPAMRKIIYTAPPSR